MLDNIVFAPAHLLNQMEATRDFDTAIAGILPHLSTTTIVDEIYCHTGLIGKKLIESGYQWCGWDDDAQMLELVINLVKF